MKTTIARTLVPAALAAAALDAPAQSATAEDISFILPAGTGCEFRLGVSWTGGNLQTKEFVDEEGTPFGSWWPARELSLHTQTTE
ncbi:hypothetical protein LJR013_002697 [Pseudarthrobacter oxydans]|uniref:hypothetical protein n=1 Tax=Pseudarthrobacter oxydans TaxID=1671 RepID=UPI003ECD5A86